VQLEQLEQPVLQGSLVQPAKQEQQEQLEAPEQQEQQD
jgi:hypothetical protein